MGSVSWTNGRISPRELQSLFAGNSGKTSSSDKDALSGLLDSLTSDKSSKDRLPPSGLGDRIIGIISGRTGSSKSSADQMTDLQALLSGNAPAGDPKQMMADRIRSLEKSGKISAADKDAMTKALDDIDALFKKSIASGTSEADARSGMDNLLKSKIDTGELTQKQSDALKDLFSHDGDGDDSAGGTTDFAAQMDKVMADLLSDFVRQMQSGNLSGYGQKGDGKSFGSAILLDYNA